MSLRNAGVLLALAMVGIHGAPRTASAGAPEQLNSVLWSPVDALQMSLGYSFGGGGMFVSQDGGKTLGWLCATAVSPELAFRKMDVHVTGAGTMLIGLVDGMLRGQSNGCGFARLAELDGQNISDMFSDPLDPKRTYVSTTTARMDNGIFADDGQGGPFVQVGTKLPGFVSSLHVVPLGTGRRLYTTGSVHNVQTNVVSYSVRYSDDEGATWVDHPYDIAQFGPMDEGAALRVVAVDPTNPDHVLARVVRDGDKDSLIHSLAMGKPGTWQLLAEPTEVTPSAITFTPDGVLYFGDSGQDTKGLFVVEKDSTTPRLITDSWRVFCLRYDPSQKRLLGCSNYFLFGTVDTTKGDLTPMFDLRCAEHFVDCPAQETTQTVCEPLARAEFCDVVHWPLSPLCANYLSAEQLADARAAMEYTCKDGVPVFGAAPATDTAAAAGTSAAAGGGGTSATGMVAAATTNAGSAAPATSVVPKTGGCGCAATANGAQSDMQGVWLVLVGAWLIMRSRRARHECIKTDELSSVVARRARTERSRARASSWA